MITHKFSVRRLKRLKLLHLRAKLLKFRFLRVGLGLKIACATLKCRILSGDEPKTLLENRRRAMFVDKFFKQIENHQKNP